MPVALMIHDNSTDRTAIVPASGRSHAPRGGDDPFERLPYQLSMVVAVPTMVTTGDGESGFDSGEGA